MANNYRNRSSNRQLRFPRSRREWISFIIIILVTLAVSGFDGVRDLFNSGSNTVSDQTVSSSLTQSFTGENFEIFTPLVQIPVAYERSVDGDTAILSINGHEIRVRYLMIDTPEIGDNPQPFALDARKRNQDLLQEASQVTIAFDKGPKTDNYGRGLVYIYADGINISETLLEEGLASVRYVNPPNNSLESTYREIQKQAENKGIGIWSNN